MAYTQDHPLLTTILNTISNENLNPTVRQKLAEKYYTLVELLSDVDTAILNKLDELLDLHFRLYYSENAFGFENVILNLLNFTISALDNRVEGIPPGIFAEIFSKKFEYKDFLAMNPDSVEKFASQLLALKDDLFTPENVAYINTNQLARLPHEILSVLGPNYIDDEPSQNNNNSFLVNESAPEFNNNVIIQENFDEHIINTHIFETLPNDILDELIPDYIKNTSAQEIDALPKDSLNAALKHYIEFITQQSKNDRHLLGNSFPKIKEIILLSKKKLSSNIFDKLATLVPLNSSLIDLELLVYIHENYRDYIAILSDSITTALTTLEKKTKDLLALDSFNEYFNQLDESSLQELKKSIDASVIGQDIQQLLSFFGYEVGLPENILNCDIFKETMIFQLQSQFTDKINAKLNSIYDQKPIVVDNYAFATNEIDDYEFQAQEIDTNYYPSHQELPVTQNQTMLIGNKALTKESFDSIMNAFKASLEKPASPPKSSSLSFIAKALPINNSTAYIELCNRLETIVGANHNLHAIFPMKIQVKLYNEIVAFLKINLLKKTTAFDTFITDMNSYLNIESQIPENALSLEELHFFLFKAHAIGFDIPAYMTSIERKLGINAIPNKGIPPKLQSLHENLRAWREQANSPLDPLSEPQLTIVINTITGYLNSKY
ncbi:MAG: hypothetical protein K2Q14_05465, partial [Gammaproteobacteria bacterium]|nr:hypothetical protein [Gammaproteobacteria bacterium]